MRAQRRGSEPTGAARDRGHEHHACMAERASWLVTPVDVPKNDKAIGDADDDKRNAAAADKQLWPSDKKEGGFQASYSETSRRERTGSGLANDR